MGDDTMFDVISRMIRTGILTEPSTPEHPIATLQKEIHSVLGRALCIRHVDAGSCNGCELEIHALNNPYYNLEGLGIKFVASPRHADLLMVTGPVSINMAEALQRTYDAIPDPKLVMAVGNCGACGGVFGSSYATLGAVENVIPVHSTILGCPPNPFQLLEGILRAAHFSLSDVQAVAR
jgi:Ni,Fe-hydrogenase III small subunit